MGKEQPTSLHSQEVRFRVRISSLVGLPPSESGVIVALANFLAEFQEHGGAFPFLQAGAQPVSEPEVRKRTCSNMCANLGFGALAI
jgi:hypothetical protein